MTDWTKVLALHLMEQEEKMDMSDPSVNRCWMTTGQRHWPASGPGRWLNTTAMRCRGITRQLMARWVTPIRVRSVAI